MQDGKSGTPENQHTGNDSTFPREGLSSARVASCLIIGPAQQQRIFNLCHDKENHHGQRTTAQDQGSKEAQEATGTRQALNKRALPTGR
jgi:hypothetical protein